MIISSKFTQAFSFGTYVPPEPPEYIDETDFTYGPAVVVDSTDVPFPGATTAVYTDGSQDGYVFTAVQPAFSPGSGDFSIEWWQKMDIPGNNFPRVFSMGSYAGTQTPAMFACSLEGSTSKTVYFWTGGTANSMGSMSTAVQQVWNHLAFTRVGTTLTYYLNGVSQSTKTSTQNLQSNFDFYIGSENNRDAVSMFKGRITNMRLVVGMSAYTGNFTTPTGELTRISAANPFGGSNTAEVPDGFTKLLFIP